MEWKQLYSVGIEEIDQQHKKLIEILTQLREATDERNAKPVIKDILNELVDYTVYHFNTEERYFDKFRYERSLEHKAEHQKFVDKVSVFVKDFENNKILLSTDILLFLTNWIQNHIRGSDKLYSKCFLENGLNKGASSQVSKTVKEDRNKTSDSIKRATKEIESSAVFIFILILALIFITGGYLVL